MPGSPSPMAFFHVIYGNGAIRDDSFPIAAGKGVISVGKVAVPDAGRGIGEGKVRIVDVAGVIAEGSLAPRDDDFCVDLWQARHPGGEGSHLR